MMVFIRKAFAYYNNNIYNNFLFYHHNKTVYKQNKILEKKLKSTSEKYILRIKTTKDREKYT